MWKIVRDKPETPEGPDPRLEVLEGLIAECRRDIEDMRKPIRDLEMEWEDWFEKFRNLYGRITKRQQRAAEEEEAEPAPDTQIATPVGMIPADVNPLALNLLRGQG